MDAPKRTPSARRRVRGAELFRANLESVTEIGRMFSDVEQRLGRLDGLVNNAARFTRFNPSTSPSGLGFHSFRQPQSGLLLLPERRPSDAQVGRRAYRQYQFAGGLRPWAEHAHYCASKAGVIMLTRALANAFAPEITVNSVAPGVIPFDDIDERGKRLIARTPAQRGGTPDEIAEAVAYFLKASNFVTGQILAVDGGLSQR